MNDRFKVRIIALDLDDTLLKDDLTISDYTVEVLHRAAENGIYIVLCSGRAENAILPYVRKLEIAGFETGRYIIAHNGAAIFDLHKRIPIYTRAVDSEILIKAYHIAEESGFSCQVYDSSTIYSPFENKWVLLDKNLSGLKLSIIEDFESFLHPGFSKMVIPGEPEKLLELQKKLKDLFKEKAVIFTSKPYFLEILPPGTGKGEALEYLAETVLKIPHEQTMSFGDSMNDESMILYAAHSTAMSNGLEHIKKIARHVTEFSNDQDGVASFVDKYCM